MFNLVPPGWPLFAARLVLLTAGTAVISEIVARIGAGFVRREGRSGPESLTIFGVGLLLGWGLLGLAWLGLALVGLFYRPLIILLPLFPLLVFPSLRSRRILLLDSVRAWMPVGWGGSLAVLAAMLPIVPHLLVPESAQDSYSYHLGAPWQFLVAHRVLIENVFMDFHLPLPVEMAFALPLSLGFERLARWMVLAHFMGAAAVWSGWCLEKGRKTAAWLGVALPLSLVYLSWNLGMTKNDAAAASLVVAGAVMLWRGRRFTAAALFGMGLSAKVVYGPVVAMLLLAGPRPFAAPLRTGVLLVMPILAWWIKSYLATSNPFFPLATGVIPTFDWDLRNSATYETYITPLQAEDTRTWAGLPLALIRHLGRDSLLAVAIIPALLYFSAWRGSVMALLVSGAILLKAGHMARFLVPVSWLLLCLAAWEVFRLPARWRGLVAGALGVWAVSQAFLNPLLHPMPWADAKSSYDQVLDDRLVTYGDAVKVLGELNPDRVLTLGELGTYRMPVRVLFSGFLGNTPLVWKMVKESHDEDGLARRFRQLGNPLILHNVVGMIWKGYRYQSFKWDTRMMRLYYGFSRKRLDLVRGPDRFDTGRGIFYLYRFQAVPRSHPYHPVAGHFLPGVATVMADVILLRNANRTEEALAQCRQLLEVLPDLGVIRSEMAFALYKGGRHAEAYRILKPMMASGVVDSKNLIIFGAVASELGDYESASRSFEWALAHFPTIQPQLQVDLADVWRHQAQLEYKKGNIVKAGVFMGKASVMLAGLKLTKIPEVERYRHMTLATLEGLRGDMDWDSGLRNEAVHHYRVARTFGADVPETAEWARRIKSAEMAGN